MKESQFINDNKDYWVSVENLIKNKFRTPEETEYAFKKISHDASLAKTFFYNRSIRVYLNGLYSQLHQILYVSNVKTKKSIITFWTDTIPLAVYDARRELLVAFVIFAVAVIIGAVSTYMDPEFPRLILGDRYIELTMENIAKGDPMSIYKDKDMIGMTVGITLNNIWVSFLTYVMGIFYMIGSALILFKNGVMVGAFQYFFVNKNLFLESFLTIWMHGTIEIASIIIAGGAGIVLGKGFAFPGTYSRVQSFVMSARRSIIILISLIPLFVIAGTIEGTLTRVTELNDGIRALFILACLAFILFYYAWYPRYKANKGYNLEVDNQKLSEKLLSITPSGEILNLSSLFYYSINIAQKLGRKLFITSSMSALFIIVYIHLYSVEKMDKFMQNDVLFLDVYDRIWTNIEFVFFNENAPFLHVIQLSVLFIVSWFVVSFFKREDNNGTVFYLPKTLNEYVKWVMFCLVSAVVILLPFLLNPIFFFIIPFIYLGLMNIIYGEKNDKVNFFTLLGLQIGLSLFYAILLASMFFVFLLLFNSYIIEFLSSFILGSFNMSEDLYSLINEYLYFFTTSFSLYIILALFLIGISVLYRSSLEIFNADNLFEGINKMGKKREIKGMERE